MLSFHAENTTIRPKLKRSEKYTAHTRITATVPHKPYGRESKLKNKTTIVDVWFGFI